MRLNHKKIIKHVITIFIASLLLFILLPLLFLLIKGPVAKANCLKENKEYLTLTSGKKVCMQKYDDAGKTCYKKDDCKGFCVQNSTEQKQGRCSELSTSKNCFDEYRGKGINETVSLDKQGKLIIQICPPIE